MSRREELQRLESSIAAKEARLNENEQHIQALLSSQALPEQMRAMRKSGVLSIKHDGLWKQFLFALYADGEFAWYRPRSNPDDPPEGSLQVANLEHIVVHKNPHYLTLTNSCSKTQLWCNDIPEVSLWAEAISQIKSKLDAAREAYHMAVTHDNVEACYAERMKGIQKVKAALEHERLVATHEGPVILTAPEPGPYLRSMRHHAVNPYFVPPPHFAGQKLDHFAEHLYDDIETDRKAAGLDRPGRGHAWLAQDLHPESPIGVMDDGARLAESLRRARLADHNAKATFERFEQGVAGSMASKISRDTGLSVSVATPYTPKCEGEYPYGYGHGGYGYGHGGYGYGYGYQYGQAPATVEGAASPAQRIMSSRSCYPAGPAAQEVQ